ncbi:arabinan endo-1,5-alpha-L-arabinosidase [Butyrivibrio sp. CB08]|uniref:glycoside hydrolase family 43 protein n=1 Tax=Butyrivibrio sp. CB08 TaxID=2364879 RepID=UPI000EA98D5B|nr:glycoside hydrolase family 43 protein [Butyrivibrio sp. CB08]RKM58765.1 arabinan endo-1,5-alpha-L-arabinosidase [Butyrivibrio sp. CB08]
MNIKTRVTVLAAGLCACFAISGCGEAATTQVSALPEEMPVEEISVGSVNSGGSLHDPQIIVGDDGTYYCYGTHMTAATSKDLSKWDMWGDGVNSSNKIFDNVIAEPFDAFSFVGKNDQGGYSVWAPSVIYNKKTGKYMMYFCTTSTYIKSNICLATSDNINGPFHYEKTIIYSGFTKPDLELTNYEEIMGDDVKTRTRYISGGAFNNQLWPNAIDPAMFYDADDRLWMVYGSWSGGIFVLELDEETGEPIRPETNDETETDAYYGKRVIGGFHHPIEGPYIHYDKTTGYYYLFLSYGNLQTDGGYQIRVLRSDKPDGTYVDVTGASLGIKGDLDNFANYGTKLMGNYTLPSLNVTYMAPGGQSTFEDKDGKLYVVYHERFKGKGEFHAVRVHQMAMNEDGWPCIFPFNTCGEALSESGYKTGDITGTFYVVDHGLEINNLVNEPSECQFADGQINGGITATYEVTEGTNFITIKTADVTYKGILVEMKDEAGNNTLCFSAIGDNNHSIWGVKYLKNADENQ